MRFVRFSLDWASSGAYKFTEDSPFFPIKSTNETAIDEITTAVKSPTDAAIYDMQGRKVINPTESGIYIQNGKKVFVNK